jgi:hypothetical protein
MAWKTGSHESMLHHGRKSTGPKSPTMACRPRSINYVEGEKRASACGDREASKRASEREREKRVIE